MRRKAALYSWWFGFILINAVLAVMFYRIAGEIEELSFLNRYLRAVVVGSGYLALIRLKFATFNYQGTEVPFGLEAFYDAGKSFIFKRINDIAIQARRDETREMAACRSLRELSEETKFSIEADMLVHSDERSRRKRWLLSVLKDTATTENEKKIALANYLKSGQMMDE